MQLHILSDQGFSFNASSGAELPVRSLFRTLELVMLLRGFVFPCHSTLKCPRAVWPFCQELFFFFYIEVVIFVLCTVLFFSVGAGNNKSIITTYMCTSDLLQLVTTIECCTSSCGRTSCSQIYSFRLIDQCLVESVGNLESRMG